MQQAWDNLNTVIKETLKYSLEEHGKPFAWVDSAPKEFYQMWNDRAGMVVLRKKPAQASELPKLSMALAY